MDAKVADLQQQLEKLANEMRRDEKDAARKLDEAAGSIRDKRIREKIRYTKSALQGSRLAVRARRWKTTSARTSTRCRRRSATRPAALGKPSKQDALARAADKTRDLVRGMESLDQRMRDRQQGQQGRRAAGQQGNRASRAAGSTGTAGSTGPAGSARPTGTARSAGSAGPAGSQGQQGQQAQGGQNGGGGANNGDNAGSPQGGAYGGDARNCGSYGGGNGRWNAGRHPPVPRRVPRVGERRRRRCGASCSRPASTRAISTRCCATCAAFDNDRVYADPQRARAAAGGGDRQAEEVRVHAAAQGRGGQRLAVAVGIRSGAGRIPAGDRGVLPVAREEAAAEIAHDSFSCFRVFVAVFVLAASALPPATARRSAPPGRGTPARLRRRRPASSARIPPPPPPSALGQVWRPRRSGAPDSAGAAS